MQEMAVNQRRIFVKARGAKAKSCQKGEKIPSLNQGPDINGFRMLPALSKYITQIYLLLKGVKT